MRQFLQWRRARRQSFPHGGIAEDVSEKVERAIQVGLELAASIQSMLQRSAGETKARATFSKVEGEARNFGSGERTFLKIVICLWLPVLPDLFGLQEAVEGLAKGLRLPSGVLIEFDLSTDSKGEGDE